MREVSKITDCDLEIRVTPVTSGVELPLKTTHHGVTENTEVAQRFKLE